MTWIIVFVNIAIIIQNTDLLSNYTRPTRSKSEFHELFSLIVIYSLLQPKNTYYELIDQVHIFIQWQMCLLGDDFWSLPSKRLEEQEEDSKWIY